MAAFDVEVGESWLPTSVVGFFIALGLVIGLLLLSIFLIALCSKCSRRSFELRDSEADKDPSALIKVAKLEEVMEERENPMINENLKDETNLNPSQGNTVSFTPWRSHLGAPQNHHDGQANGVAAVKDTASHSETAGESNPEEQSSAPFPLWRSHLSPDVNSSSAPDNIYHTIGGGGSSADADAPSVLTNHGPGEEPGVCHAATGDSVDVNSVYAQVSMKERSATPPVPPAQEVLEEEEASAPPLPDRRTLKG